MPSCHSEKGFSLPEALVAAGLLAGALATLSALAAMSTRASSDAVWQTAAALLVRQKLEALLAEVRASGLSTPAGVEQITPAGASGRGSGDAMYTRRWWVDPLPQDPGAVVLRVEVVRAGAAPAETVRVATIWRAGPR